MINSVEKRVPKVLFIRNVFMHDCIDVGQSIESKLLDVVPMGVPASQDVANNYGQRSDISQTQTVGNGDITMFGKDLVEGSSPKCSLMELTEYVSPDYQKLPRVFESIETWPKATNLHCWYCCNQFTGVPKFVPLVVEPNVHTKNDDKYIIEVDGVCCRWPCAISYIYETTKDMTKAVEKINNLYFLYKLFHGKYPAYIPAAPDKYMQCAFGGDVSREKYYELYTELELQHCL